jgi:very-short-patch-repair endonuclease
MNQDANRLRWSTADISTYEEVESNAIKNRRFMTQAEERLWQELRGNKLGIHFRRQHVIGIYIADFVSLKNHLVIEIDGDYHLTPEQQELDHIRTIYMEQQGFRVIRFRNSQVLTDIERVMSKIIKSLI